MRTCDILLVGVGGQGVVTLGDLLARSAVAADVPVTYVPTKGMAQRGGFVKVEVRLGRLQVGPRIAQHSADLLLSMERSETLKGLVFVHPKGRIVLYNHVWEPTGVLLGQAAYPSQSDVIERVRAVCEELVCLEPSDRPEFDGRLVAANIYALGALAGSPALRRLIDPRILQETVVDRWPKAAEGNLAAFHAGYVCGNGPSGQFLGGTTTSRGSEQGRGA